MKKVMFRGYEKEAISRYLPNSMKYNTWYEYVTPFDWQYIRIKKGSRHVEVYQYVTDKKPEFRIKRKKFIKNYLSFCKGNLYEVTEDYFDEDGFPK